MTTYKTIAKPSVAEFKDRGSKFIGYAFPIKNVEEFKHRLFELKMEHPKATHHCFAYRLGIDRNNFRVSDDGEPSGTAGRPILGQIDSRQLTNILIVVVRYFGGSLLGVPRLINAYKSAAGLALQGSIIVQKAIEKNFQIEFDYTRMNDVMRVVKQFHCTVFRQDTHLFCKMEMSVPIADLDNCVRKLEEISGLELKDMNS